MRNLKSMREFLAEGARSLYGDDKAEKKARALWSRHAGKYPERVKAAAKSIADRKLTRDETKTALVDAGMSAADASALADNINLFAGKSFAKVID